MTDDEKATILKLLAHVGEEARCRGCQAPIWWVTHRNGRRAPYTAEGLNHFIDCPRASDFRS